MSSDRPESIHVYSVFPGNLLALGWLAILLIITPPVCQAQNLDWAASFSSAQTGSISATDSKNNVITVGHFIDTMDADPGPGVFNLIATLGAAYIQKLNDSGQFVWAKVINTPHASDRAYSLTVDDTGNIYVAGEFFWSSIDMDPGPGSHLLYGTPSTINLFLLKLDSAGNFKWAKNLGRGQSMNSLGFGVHHKARLMAIDRQGRLNVICHYLNNFSPHRDATLAGLMPSKGYSVSCLIRLTLNGQFLSHQELCGPGSNLEIASMAIDPQGNLVFGGSFQGTVDLDPGPGTYSASARGFYDGFLTKIDSTGKFLWGRTLSSKLSVHVTSLAINAKSEIHVIGGFQDTVDLDPSPASFLLMPPFQNYTQKDQLFVWTLDSGGNFFWAKGIMGTNPSARVYGASLALDTFNNIFITGHYQGAVDFDPGTNVYTHYGTYVNQDLFVEKLDSSGTMKWAYPMVTPASGMGYGSAICLNNNQELVVTGTFRQILDFDPGPFTHNLTSSGFVSPNVTSSQINHFVFKWDQGETTIDSIHACDSLTWIDGKTYYQDDTTGFQVLINREGFDSIVHLYLELDTTTYFTDTLFACDSLRWINGKLYLQSNFTDQDTLMNAQGCDSIVSLHLTIAKSNFQKDTLTACDSLTWLNGKVYTQSNYTDSIILMNADGCDSIIQLHLTLGKESYKRDTVTACDSYTWRNDKTYTSDNHSDRDTLKGFAGCDSIFHLHLSLYHSSFYTDSVQACDSFTWLDGKTYYSSTKSAQFTTVNQKGCDSVITLNLEISRSSYSTDSIQACESYTWIDGVTYFGDNRTASYTYNSAHGCDSIIQLYLTIDSIDSRVEKEGNLLRALAETGSVQWLKCDSLKTEIDGARDKTFEPYERGKYSVKVVDGPCTAYSDCFEIDWPCQLKVTAYPNPTWSREVYLKLDQICEPFRIDLVGELGQTLSSTQYPDYNQAQIRLIVSTACYFIMVTTESGQRETLKIIKGR